MRLPACTPFIPLLVKFGDSFATMSSSFPMGSKPLKPMPFDKPRLYIYEHCPHCVKVRVALGLKNIPHTLAFLANDEVEIPMSLVGKKVVPILELGVPGEESHEVLRESLDICKRLDEDEAAFGPQMLAPLSDRNDLTQFMEANADLMRRLIRPRHVNAPLAEFQLKASREAFIRNHPLKEPSLYEDNLANTPALKKALEEQLLLLEPMIHSPDCCSLIFPSSRSITIIKDLVIPPKLLAYLKTFSEKADVPV
ncbi:unnamed protein product, partial [Chrysoparadoxa australica]